MRDIFVANSAQHCTECTLANHQTAHRFRPNALPRLLRVSVSECSFTCESHKGIKRKPGVCLFSRNPSSRGSWVKWSVSHSFRFELGKNTIRWTGGWVVSKGRSGEEANPSSLTRNERRTVQPVTQPLYRKYQKRFSLTNTYGSNYHNTINLLKPNDIYIYIYVVPQR